MSYFLTNFMKCVKPIKMLHFGKMCKTCTYLLLAKDCSFVILKRFYKYLFIFYFFDYFVFLQRERHISLLYLPEENYFPIDLMKKFVVSSSAQMANTLLFVRLTKASTNSKNRFLSNPFYSNLIW